MHVITGRADADRATAMQREMGSLFQIDLDRLLSYPVR
jgi:hypothetical protein